MGRSCEGPVLCALGRAPWGGAWWLQAGLLEAGGQGAVAKKQAASCR